MLSEQQLTQVFELSIKLQTSTLGMGREKIIIKKLSTLGTFGSIKGPLSRLDSEFHFLPIHFYFCYCPCVV